MTPDSTVEDPTAIGWREWIGIPGLGIESIKAKVDTGARTSALHAFAVKRYRRRGVRRVRFSVHPLQNRVDIVVACDTEVVDERMVIDSGGHREKRIVILSAIRMGGIEWPIEMTLTRRDTMHFRMLLGRTALGGRFVVHPGKSYLLGKPPGLVRTRKGTAESDER